MLGFTIDKSIELLEMRVKALEAGGGGGGGASTWGQLQNKPFNTLGEEFYNLDGALTLDTVSADKVALPESSQYEWDYLPQAIEALAEDSNHFSDDIAQLEETVESIKNVYSTEEVQIGTYKGKPLYRKIVEEAFGAYPGGHVVPIDVPGDYTPVNYECFRVTPDEKYIYKAYSTPTSSGYYFIVERFDSSGITYRSGGWNSGIFRAFVEYTKD